MLAVLRITELNCCNQIFPVLGVRRREQDFGIFEWLTVNLDPVRHSDLVLKLGEVNGTDVCWLPCSRQWFQGKAGNEDEGDDSSMHGVFQIRVGALPEGV